ncbi:hypothetical protein BKA64DRAFT_239480 [Cadophora sp. MPI-SDFR-AT-0126]|nr:hypothetical protein BKA64DRAFT_239480 [Leotiomycetes sp. MPI-SDFR-AT-0126]
MRCSISDLLYNCFQSTASVHNILFSQHHYSLSQTVSRNRRTSTMATLSSPLKIGPSPFRRAQCSFTLTLPPATFQLNGPIPSMAFIHPALTLTHLNDDVISVLSKLHHSDHNHPNPPLYDLTPFSSTPPRFTSRGELEMNFGVDRNHSTAHAGWLRHPLGLSEMQNPIACSGYGMDYDVDMYLRRLMMPLTAEEFQLVFKDVAAFRQLAPY